MAESRIDVFIRLKDQLSSGLKKIKAQFVDVNKQAEELDKQSTSNVSKEYDRLEKEIKDIKTATEQATSQLNTVRNAGLAIAGIGAALAAPFLIGARAAAKFSREIAEVGTLVPDVVQSNEELRATVRRLSNEFGTSRSDIAQGLYQAISSGALAGAEANEILRIALITARGGVTSVTAAVDGLSTILNSFGLEASDAEKVADSLFVTVKNGRTTIDELSRFLFQAAPIASQLGLSYQELNAALVTLTKQGVPTRVAFTQIRSAINGLVRDTPELNEIFDKLGGAQKVLAEKGLAGTLQLIAEAAQGDVGVLNKLLGSIEGVGAVLGLTGVQLEEFRRQLEAQKNASGDASAAADEVAESFGEQLSQAIERVSNLFEALGNVVVPILRPIVNAVGAVAVALQRWIDTPIGAFVSTLVATLGVLLIVFGSLVTTVAVLGVGFVSLRGGLAILRSRMQLFALSTTAAGTAMRGLGLAMRFAFPVVGVVVTVLGLFAGAMNAANAGTEELIDSTDRLRATFNDLADTKQVAAVREQARNIGILTNEVKKADDELKRLQSRGFLGGVKGTVEEIEAATTALVATEKKLEDAKQLLQEFEDDLGEITEAEIDVGRLDALKQGLIDAEAEVARLETAFKDADDAAKAITIREFGVQPGQGFLARSAAFQSTEADLQGAIQDEAQKKAAETRAELLDQELADARRVLALREEELQVTQLRATALKTASDADAAALAAIEARIEAADRELEVTKQITQDASTRASNAQRELQAIQALAEARDQSALESGEIDQKQLVQNQQQRIRQALASDLEGLNTRLAATRARGLAEIEALQAEFAQKGSDVTQEQIDNAQSKLAIAEESLVSAIRVTAVGAATALEQTGIDLADALLSGFDQQFTNIATVLQSKLIQLQAALDAGTISQQGFAEGVRAANKTAADSFASLREQLLAALSVATGPEAEALVSLIGLIDGEVKRLANTISLFEQQIITATEGALADFFETVLTDVGSVNEAFTQLLQNIGDQVKRLIAEKLANKLIESLFGADGSGSVLGSLFGSKGGGQVLSRGGYITQAARGGYLEGKLGVQLQKAARGGRMALRAPSGGKVTGPGTKTSDSIPAMLSAGEYVIKAASVDRYGLQLMEAINRGIHPTTPRSTSRRKLSITRPRRIAFADGGFVGTTPLESQAGAGSKGIQNAAKAQQSRMTLEVNEATLNLTMRDFLEREFGRIMATR